MSRSPPLDKDHPDATQLAGTAPSRRIHARLETRRPVTLLMPDASLRQATTVDISRLGMSLTTDKPIAPGSKCTVRFDSAPGTSAPVDLAAKAVYSSYTSARNFRIGLVFADAVGAQGLLQQWMEALAAPVVLKAR